MMDLISVTQALSLFNDFSRIPSKILETACERGKRVHSACCAYAKGFFVIDLPMEWSGYFGSFKKWFDSHVEEVYFAEERFEDSDLGFYGSPDLGVRLERGFNIGRAIIDLKTPAVESKSWRAQTAAYQHLANRKYGPNFFDGHMALKLNIDGKPAKGILYQNEIRDFTAFMSALNCYRYFRMS